MFCGRAIYLKCMCCRELPLWFWMMCKRRMVASTGGTHVQVDWEYPLRFVRRRWVCGRPHHRTRRHGHRTIGTNYFVQEFKRRSRLFVFQLLLFILLLTFVAFTHESLLKQRRCQKSLDIISERRLWLTNSRDIHFVSFKRNWVAKKRKKHSIVRVLVKI